MRLSKILAGIEGEAIYEASDWEREIDVLSVDSRKKTSSSLFFCLSGGRADSHAYAEEAIKNGAVAVVTERVLSISAPQILVSDSRRALGVAASIFFGEPSKRLKMIGITGTNGKTTTSYMLENILKAAGKKVGIIGTLGIIYGGREYPSRLTTPDPVELQRTLAKMVSFGVEYVVMEVSAHALYYQKTAGISFRAGIFSNLSQDHLDFFKDMPSYKQAKMRLFEKAVCETAIINGDEEVGREIGKIRAKSGERTVFYGLQTPCDAFAVVTRETLCGSDFVLNLNDRLCPVSLALTGRYNVYNALSAATCAIELGVGVREIEKGLNTLPQVKGRMERVSSYCGGVYVDFAHTPDGLKKALESLKAHCRGRLVCLFGCGGNRDKTKRSKMGEVAARFCDFSVLTSDNPRYEDPLDILSEIQKGYRELSSRYVVVPDRAQAIAYALDFLKANDVLLVAGKGAEETQEIIGIKYPFSDQAIIKELLRGKGEV